MLPRVSRFLNNIWRDEIIFPDHRNRAQIFVYGQGEIDTFEGRQLVPRKQFLVRNESTAIKQIQKRLLVPGKGLLGDEQGSVVE